MTPQPCRHRTRGDRGGARLVARLGLGLVMLAGALGVRSDPGGPGRTQWTEAILAARAALHRTSPEGAEGPSSTLLQRWHELEREFPVACDWWLQDAGERWWTWFSQAEEGAFERRLIQRVLDELGPGGDPLRREYDRLAAARPRAGGAAWLELYHRAAEQRRRQRLAGMRSAWPRVVFTQHYDLGGSHYAYTEGQSDAQHERTFQPDAALCLLEWDADQPKVRTLIDDPAGVIRDPDVSWDGQRILFAWKKSDREDDYHLYEMDAGTGAIRQLTGGLGFADYEPAYLPDGNIVFNSTRCVQTVDCWWTEVSNLYTCDANGQHLRRLTFDQVHDNYPAVLPDGRVIYTRWEYNDRGQIYVQGLFQMNADGTGQTAFYGNNSWFPTALLHARGIPGTQKVVAIFAGHHTRQAGKLGLLDPSRGREEDHGAQLIAPLRPTFAERIDAYGQDGELFQYPYPLNESEFLVTYSPWGWERQPTRFGIYYLSVSGRRECLVADRNRSCNQPVPLAARARLPKRPNLVDESKRTGTYYVQNVYAGPGLAGVSRSVVKRLRVVALEFRAAGIGWNYNEGPAGAALSSTPVSIGNGAWDVKVVLGDARVHPDGSACFEVPARTPVYFQALDDRGYAVQTMRSWSTLQPGETASCVGCHESRNATPAVPQGMTLALRAGPEPLTPFHGASRGFSFVREIQPILDRHCVRCHHDSDRLAARLGLTPELAGLERVDVHSPGAPADGTEVAFSLSGDLVVEALAKRRWTEGYLGLVGARLAGLEGNTYLAGNPTGLVNWVSAQSVPSLLPPYAHGAARSRLLEMVIAGHHGVRLSPGELEVMACWIDLAVPFCGDYTEGNSWTPEEVGKYEHFLQKRRRGETVPAATSTGVETVVGKAPRLVGP